MSSLLISASASFLAELSPSITAATVKWRTTNVMIITKLRNINIDIDDPQPKIP